MTESEARKNIIAYVTMEYENLPVGMSRTLGIAIKALEEIQQYRALEKRLLNMFGGSLTLEAVVDDLELALKEPDSPHPMNARILTYKESADWDAYRAIGTPEELQKAQKEEKILKFYYCDTEDSYLLGRRVGNFYYAHYCEGHWVFDMSRYLPWGKHVVDEGSLWKEHTYPSEPREIDFHEWIDGFIKKECGGTVEELAQATKYMRLAKQHGIIGNVIEKCAEYEAIGTVEECREAVEKQKAKRP